MHLTPSTAQGRWAELLLGVSIISFAAFFGLVALGERGGDTFFSNMWLTGPILLSALSAIAAGGAGLAAVRHRDRSVVVFIAVLVGVSVAEWAVAELAFPH